MLARIPIRWRITLFHILTVLGIGTLFTIGMFAVFGIGVSDSVEQLARSRANEAARIVESTGSLTENDLVSLNRDGVFVIALDENGRVVSQIGSGVAEGAQSDSGFWPQVRTEGEGSGGQRRALFAAWNEEPHQGAYTYTEPVRANGSTIRVIETGTDYDQLDEPFVLWVALGFVGFGIIAFILTMIGSIFLVRYSLAPVTAIAKSASEISAADLSRRLPVRSGRDELGHLAVTFNALLDRLEAAFKDREEALAHQRRFVADASHELRTPLTSILGYAQMLRRWGLDHPEASTEAVARMEAEAIRMEALVDGLLQLARGDEAGPPLMADEDLAAVVRESTKIATGAEPIEPRITLRAPDAPVIAHINREAIRQVLGILLDNARKYSAPGATITVTIGDDDNAAIVAVTDTGPGIATEHHEHIFERFYRTDASRTTHGAGLGLAIARDIVARHCGSITVASEPGHGATFTVRLPLPASTQSVLPDQRLRVRSAVL
jgi:signal transduction histidine kinase